MKICEIAGPLRLPDHLELFPFAGNRWFIFIYQNALNKFNINKFAIKKST